MTTDSTLATRPQVASLDFTDEQRQMIRDTYANGANDREFSVLIEIAKKRRLDPMLRQIHFVQRWNTDLKRMVWAPQVSIDGLRAIAQRTGLYDGQDEPIFEDRNGELYVCKVRVYRRDWPSNRPAVGVAYWSEYVQTTKDGSVTRMWRQMPHVMLSKVAESIALRKAFPEDCGGLYTDDEMGQADNDAPRTADVRRDRMQLAPPATPTQEPPQRPANPLEGRGIEAPASRPQNAAETPAQRDHIREATAYVGGDNPTLGEHNRAVAEAQAMPAVPAWRVALDTLADEVPSLAPFCNDVEKATLPSACGDAFRKHRAIIGVLSDALRERAWKVLCERCIDAGQKNAKAWLKRYIAETDAKDAAKAAQTDAPAATEVTP